MVFEAESDSLLDEEFDEPDELCDSDVVAAVCPALASLLSP